MKQHKLVEKFPNNVYTKNNNCCLYCKHFENDRNEEQLLKKSILWNETGRCKRYNTKVKYADHCAFAFERKE